MKTIARSALAFMLVTLIGAASLVTSPAYAADILDNLNSNAAATTTGTPKSLGTGPYIGAGVGLDVHAIDTGEGIEGINASFDGVAFTGRLGYDISPRRHVVLGVFGDVDYSTAGAAGVDTDFSYKLGARAGAQLGGALLYVNGGYVWSDFKGVDYSPDGPFAGIGMQTDLGNGFSLAVEGSREWSEDSVDGQDVEQEADKIKLMLMKKL